MDYRSILYQYFGFSDFRGIQQDIVESIGSGNDTLGLMPTGGGKSVTFQVPALAMEGVCIVVTPLIALMKDQVQHLRDRGILASAIYSGLSHAEILQVLDNAVYGGVKFLYVSPERLSSPLFVAKVKQMRLCFIAVDEAHCISQWGYDFRPSYLRIADIRNILEPHDETDAEWHYSIPILALTATATPKVVDDIRCQLQFHNAFLPASDTNSHVFRMSFRRENLVYVVRHTENKEAELLHILRSVSGSAIVYTRSRRGTKDVAKMLTENGVIATFYHAGLDFAVKDQRQADWQSDLVRVMVATNAFGMGIDKPDVRVVVHMDCPDSLEAYFQEAGRAGRDGNRSYAVLLYNKHDRNAMLSRIPAAFPEKEYIRKVYDDLAYFFQLAMYDGEGARYEFDIERFCIVFKHFPTRLLGALSILQRAGYIEYDSDPDTHPRCRFIIGRDDIYRFSGLSEVEDKVIMSLLRTYCGLFSDLAYIEERVIADGAGIDVDAARIALKMLSRKHIIKYIPRRNVPTIFYPHQRVESSRLLFDKSIYEDLMEQMKARVDSVLQYAEMEDRCRSTILLDYFGEKAVDSCGRCDVCVAMRDSIVSNMPTDNIQQMIIGMIVNAGGSMHVSQLNTLTIPRNQLLSAIDALCQKEKIKMDKSRVTLCK